MGESINDLDFVGAIWYSCVMAERVFKVGDRVKVVYPGYPAPDRVHIIEKVADVGGNCYYLKGREKDEGGVYAGLIWRPESLALAVQYPCRCDPEVECHEGCLECVLVHYP